MARSWKLRHLFSYKICCFIPARITFIMLFIILEYTFFIVHSWPWSFLNIHKLGRIPKLTSNSASWICLWCVISCFLSKIMIRSWCLLSLSQIFTIRSSNNNSIFLLKCSIMFISSWRRSKNISVKCELMVRFRSRGHWKVWSLIFDSKCIIVILMRPRRGFWIIDCARTHWPLLPIANACLWVIGSWPWIRIKIFI